MWSLTDLFAGIVNGVSSIANAVSNWFSPPCGANFCTIATGVSNIPTVSASAGGTLGAGGGAGGGNSGGSVPVFSTTVTAKTRPCPAGATAAGLTYTPSVRQHIEQLHMIFLPNGQGNNFTYYRRGGVDIPRSQYYFSPSGTPDQNWNLVMQINAQTFSLAMPQPSGRNVLFTATLGPQNNPVPGARPFLGIDYSGSFYLFGFKVPVMKSYTSTNTLVTRSDCQTVVSSYAGNP